MHIIADSVSLCRALLIYTRTSLLVRGVEASDEGSDPLYCLSKITRLTMASSSCFTPVASNASLALLFSVLNRAMTV